jgi:glycerol-1-phosphate dehydrogenase [NAD(P)+]
MMSKLHGLDWEKIAETLREVGAPTSAREIGLSDGQVVKALVAAQSLRPDRYTILSKVKLDKTAAKELAHSTGVI